MLILEKWHRQLWAYFYILSIPKHFLQTFFLTEVINFSRFVQLHFYIFPFLKCSSKVLMLSEQS